MFDLYFFVIKTVYAEYIPRNHDVFVKKLVFQKESFHVSAPKSRSRPIVGIRSSGAHEN